MGEDRWLSNRVVIALPLLLIIATSTVFPYTSVALEESLEQFSITLRYSGVYSVYMSGEFSPFPDSTISITVRYWIIADVVFNGRLLIDSTNLSLAGIVSAIDGAPAENMVDLKNNIEALLKVNLTLANMTGEELPLIPKFIFNESGVQLNLRELRYNGSLTGIVRLDVDGFLFTGKAGEGIEAEFWTILYEPFTHIPIQFSSIRRISTEEGTYIEMVTLNLDNYVELSRLSRRNVYEIKLTTGNTTITFPLVILSAITGATENNTTVSEFNTTLVITGGSSCILVFGPVPRDINVSSNVYLEKYNYMQKNVFVTLYPVSCEKGVYISFQANESEASPHTENIEQGVVPRYYRIGAEDVIFAVVFIVFTCIVVYTVVYIVSRRVV